MVRIIKYAAMYGINEAIAAKEERIADENINPFRSEANSIQRAYPLFGLDCFDFVFAIAQALLKKIVGEVSIS